MIRRLTLLAGVGVLSLVPCAIRAQNAGQVPDSIAVLGLHRLPRSSVLLTAGLAAGRPVSFRDVQRAIREHIAKGCHLILTTGGTGVALRDVTPEAVREIAVRELPGFGEIMRSESMKITKNAILSRNLAVVVDKSLVICLPGKPTGAVECLGFVVGAVPHCVEVLQEVPTSC